MSTFADYLEGALLDEVFGITAYVVPVVSIALYSANPTDAGGGTELVDGTSPGYARTADLSGAANWTRATSTITNDNNIDQVATGNWLGATGMAILDNTTGGNFLMWDAFPSTVTLLDGDTGRFAANTGITVTLD